MVKGNRNRNLAVVIAIIVTFVLGLLGLAFATAALKGLIPGL